MNKTSEKTKKSNDKMHASRSKQEEVNRRVSSDFLATRESRYQIVDIIDYLFDVAIG